MKRAAWSIFDIYALPPDQDTDCNLFPLRQIRSFIDRNSAFQLNTVKTEPRNSLAQRSTSRRLFYNAFDSQELQLQGVPKPPHNLYSETGLENPNFSCRGGRMAMENWKQKLQFGFRASIRWFQGALRSEQVLTIQAATTHCALLRLALFQDSWKSGNPTSGD